jgi:hypothetical protein
MLTEPQSEFHESELGSAIFQYIESKFWKECTPSTNFRPALDKSFK